MLYFSPHALFSQAESQIYLEALLHSRWVSLDYVLTLPRTWAVSYILMKKPFKKALTLSTKVVYISIIYFMWLVGFVAGY